MLDYIGSSIYNLSLVIAGLIVTALVCLYLFQDKMIYQPNPITVNLPTPDLNPPGYRNPAERNIPYEDVYITTSDNIKIHTWLMKRPESNAATIIYFHGNAGNLGFRLDIYEQLYKSIKVNVLAVSYRGYGFSEGKPSELGIYIDTDAIIKYILGSQVNPKRIYLFGASLGGAVAIYAAHKYKEVFLYR